MFFKLSGSLFHEDGPETEKERGPKVLVRVRGIWRLPCAAERSGTKMMNTRQLCQHLAEVCGGLTTKAPEDDETEFVGDSLSDR